MKKRKEFELKVYTKRQLRMAYGIGSKAFRTWMRRLPETSNTGHRNYLSVKEVEAFVTAYGIPYGKLTNQK